MSSPHGYGSGWSSSRRPILARSIDAAYRRRGPAFVHRALLIQLGLAFPVALTAALLTLFYVPLSLGDLAILIVLSQAIWALDVAMRVGLIRHGLLPYERWWRQRDENGARAAWRSLADLPYAPLGQRGPNLLVALLLVVWAVAAGRLLELDLGSSILFLPGSLVVWVYVLALRFFVMEQLLRPVLADVGRDLPDGGGVAEPRITLARRLLIAVSAIIVIAGTVVAGLVGEREVSTLALGVGASIVVAATIASWLASLLADSVAGPVAELCAAADRVGRGDLQTTVPVVSLDETGALARSFNAMVGGLRERDRIREAFGTYVDRDVAEHILREGTDLAGEQVEVTIMFVDIRGFTAYAEDAAPSEVVTTINRLFGRLVPVVREHGGHVDKFVGDGLMAVFGAPRRQRDHADQALSAALAIADAVEEEFEGRIEIGIGLNSGSVIAGNVGGEGRLEFSVIGDAVNVAARIEGATRETGDVILVSQRTRELLAADATPLTERSNIRLKGKRQPASLFAPDQSAQAPPAPSEPS